MAEPGGGTWVPVGVSTSVDLRQDFTYGSNRNLRKYEGEVVRKAIPDMAVGQTMVFQAEEVERIDGLRITQVEILEEFVLVLGLTFQGPQGSAGRKQRSSVNADKH